MSTGCPKCGEKLDYFNSKLCKFCDQKVCFKHLQPENHDCPVVKYTKYIRKKWLRKKGQNITLGKYIVVCDECGYRSNREIGPIGTSVENEQGAFIEVAGAELEKHSQLKGCSKDKIFLEQTNEDEMDKVRGMYLVDDNKPKAKEYRRI